MRICFRRSATFLFGYGLFIIVLCIILIYGRYQFSGIEKPRKTYVGGTGWYRYFDQQDRNYSVGSEILAQCIDTRFTQCNPLPKRTDADRIRDRARRPPFKIAMLRRPDFMSKDPTLDGCEYDNCEFIGTGSQFAQHADAFFVYAVRLRDVEFLPPSGRRPGQTYIVGTWEAPIFTNADFLSDSNSPWNRAFNATFTYRLDSDIVHGYGRLDFQPPQPGRIPDYLQIAKNKRRTAVWMVSNCGSESKRNEYVQEMQKYIDIDIYGKCGQPCPVYDEKCVPNLVSTYRFYLAFENSFCTDYVTEKFFKFYRPGFHIIPVVRGGVNYTREFPKKSLINSADFSSPKDLALFLKRLAADDQEFSSYLGVKDSYTAVTYEERFCQICEYLHLNQGKTKVIADAKKWYGDGHCWAASDI